MKAIFLFLVVINLAYLGWQAWIVPPKAPPALIEGAGVPRLVLIDEDPTDPAFSAPYEPTRMTLEAAAAFVQPKRAQAKPAQRTRTPAVLEVGAGEQQTGELPDAPAVQQAREQVVDQAGQSTQEQVAAQATQQESIEAETPDETQSAAAMLAGVDDPPGTVEVAMAPVGLRCVSLGPFLNLREATEATAMLIETGLDASQRLAESQVWFGHWVHLPPQDSREAAVAIVEDLRQKGVSDIYIEPSGPMQNSISLGVFSDRKHAETRAGNIRKLGIRPQIRDRYRDSSVYWVDFELPQGQLIDPNAYQASSRRVLRLEGRDCPDNT